MAVETRDELLGCIQDLQDRLAEAEETLRALRSGEVDAVVASGPDGDQIYTLRGADKAYRVMVQGMAEGAVTLTPAGLILFANEQFGTMVRAPLERVIGSQLQNFVAPEDADLVSALLTQSTFRKSEVRLRTDDAALVPVYLAIENLLLDGAECFCLIVTDLSEQKRNEEIVAAEKLARSILEQAAEAILVVDPEGRISRASRAAERLAGAPILQRGFDEVFRISLAGADYPFPKLAGDAAHGQAIKNIEATAVVADGRTLDLLVSAAVLSGTGSEPLGWVLNMTDITERKHKERQLKYQADIIETTADAVVAIDPNQQVTFWNAGAERLYGVSRKEALGRRLTELYQYVWAKSGEQRAQVVLETQGMWSGENIHVRRDGTQIVVSSTVNVIKPEYGGGAFAVIRDITERKKTEEILRESEARERNRAAELQAIMDAVPAAVFIAGDPEGRHMIGNRMSYDLLRALPGANISKSAPAGERPEHFRPMKKGKEIAPEDLPVQVAARTGRAVHEYELDLVFDGGDARQWIGNAVPLFDQAGQARGAVGAFLDITERKRSEERLRQAQKLESIGLLAGGIAHDFNNLLVGVIGNASLAQELLPPDHDAVEMLQGISAAGEQLARLTRQMLAYSGKGRFVMERLSLSDLIPGMIGLVQPFISKKIALELELEPDLPPIEADRGQMQQVFMNLVINAAEAIGPHAGQIVVKTGVQPVDEEFIRRNPEAADLSPGKHVYLEVRDTGDGMDPETKSKIFDPFFTTKFVGRGLGLAAVDGIVRGHKGAIRVTSAPGKGSCFTVMFPAHVGAARQQPANVLAAGNGSGTVLVVDDEQLVRNLAKRILNRYGYDVLLAGNGVEAIQVLKAHPGDISVVVLDLSMPGMSGEEALPELRKVRPGVQVVVSSGYSEDETLALFKGQRVSGFIQKPYTPERFAEKIKSTLG